MERLPMENGRVVTSRQGRDAGRSFIVMSVIDEKYVMMADGRTRKLDHQKKKKVIHLHPRPYLMEDLMDRKARNVLQDSDLRHFLDAAGLGIEQPLCKED